MPVLVICKNEGDLEKIEAARVMTRFFPCEVNGSYVLPWQPEFHIDQPENIIMQSFPLSDDASCEIRSRLANWLQRYTCTLLRVWTRTTDAGSCHTNSSLEPSAQVSDASFLIK